MHCSWVWKTEPQTCTFGQLLVWREFEVCEPVLGDPDSAAVPTVISAELVAVDAALPDRAEPAPQSSRKTNLRGDIH